MCFRREPPKRIPKRPEVLPLPTAKRGRGQPPPWKAQAWASAGSRRQSSTCPRHQLSTSPGATFKAPSWIFLMQGRWPGFSPPPSSSIYSSVHLTRFSSSKEMRVKSGSPDSFLVKNLYTRPRDTTHALLPFPETFQE